jgi:hypothetical protein
MRKKKIINIIGGVFFVSAIAFWVINNFYKYDQLSQNFAIGEGIINQIAPATYKNNNQTILYEFTVMGKKYTGENSLSLCGDLTNENVRSILVNRHFPVAYSPRDTTLSIIIITQKDAKRFNYAMTDFLRISDSVLTCK